MKANQKQEDLAIWQAQSWAEELEEIAILIGGRFSRSESRERALTYLRGLPSPVERKNGWQLTEEAGDQTPYDYGNQTQLTSITASGYHTAQ